VGLDLAVDSRQVVRTLSRSDNCTKNHFYSRLRKALRRLNKTIAERFHKEYREIKIDLLYKIIEIAEENFRGEMRLDELLPEECLGRVGLM
jgi:hypothetical protein